MTASMKARDACSVVGTGRVGDIQVATERHGEHGLRRPSGAGGFFDRGNHGALRSISLSFASYRSAFVEEFPAFDAFAQQFWVRGSAQTIVDGTAVAVSSDQSPVISPGTQVTATCSAGFEQCALRIDPRALTSKFTALTGAPPRRDLKFAPVADLRLPSSHHLRQLFMFLADQLGNAGSIPPLALAELEQSMMVAFLCGNRHDHSHLLDRPRVGAAPWQVRRAEEYIEANWDQPITVEALAAATGASARSIFHVFKESRGYSPMVFLRQVRLRHARRMLMTPGADTSVTTVAIDCGFSNLGNFAKEYDRMFDELPSATRNRTRGLRQDAERIPPIGHLARGVTREAFSARSR